MPNHVRHKMTIVGPDEAVRAFVAKARAVPQRTGDEAGSVNCRPEDCPALPLEFGAIVPLGPEYSEHPYSVFGYNREHEIWGVKWGAYDQEEPMVSKGRVTYTFTCAWGLPEAWLIAASRSWPMLRFFVSWGGEGPTRGHIAYASGWARDRIDPTWEEDKANYPKYVEDDPAFDEDKYYDAHKAAEREYINGHDAWVASRIDA